MLMTRIKELEDKSESEVAIDRPAAADAQPKGPRRPQKTSTTGWLNYAASFATLYHQHKYKELSEFIKRLKGWDRNFNTVCNSQWHHGVPTNYPF